MWKHPTDGFEHVSNCEREPNNLKPLKSELRKVLILVLESKILCFTNCCHGGGDLPSFNVVKVNNITSKFYMGHLPILIVSCL